MFVSVLVIVVPMFSHRHDGGCTMMNRMQLVERVGMGKTGALLKGPRALSLARELKQEVAQYGKREPKPVKSVVIITRRKGEPDRRTVYA